MTKEIIKILIQSGLDEETIKQLPLPILFADKVDNQPNSSNLKRALYESSYHSTTKMPQTFFYKHISTILNIELEHG